MTADGRWLFTGSADRTIRQWDLSDGQVARVLAGHGASVGALGLDGAGRLLISGDQSGDGRVWEIDSGQCRHELLSHSDAVIAIAVDAVGARAVTASIDHTAKVWDLRDGILLQELLAHTGRLSGVRLTPDDTLAVTTSWDRTACVWDLSRAGTHARTAGHSSEVEEVAIAERTNVGISAARTAGLSSGTYPQGRSARRPVGMGISSWASPQAATAVALSQDPPMASCACGHCLMASARESCTHLLSAPTSAKLRRWPSAWMGDWASSGTSTG